MCNPASLAAFLLQSILLCVSTIFVVLDSRPYLLGPFFVSRSRSNHCVVLVACFVLFPIMLDSISESYVHIISSILESVVQEKDNVGVVQNRHG